jgi:hypothetical protein
VNNSVLVENGAGLMAFVIGPGATGHAFADKYVEVSNSVFVGRLVVLLCRRQCNCSFLLHFFVFLFFCFVVVVVVVVVFLWIIRSLVAPIMIHETHFCSANANVIALYCCIVFFPYHYL